MGFYEIVLHNDIGVSLYTLLLLNWPKMLLVLCRYWSSIIVSIRFSSLMSSISWAHWLFRCFLSTTLYFLSYMWMLLFRWSVCYLLLNLRILIFIHTRLQFCLLLLNNIVIHTTQLLLIIFDKLFSRGYLIHKQLLLLLVVVAL